MNSTRSRRRVALPAVGMFSTAMLCVTMAATPAQAGGSSWRVVQTTDYSQYDALTSVVAPGKTDAWAFGAQRISHSDGPVALHWTGTTWNTVALPAEVNGAPTAADASSSTDVWVAGSQDGFQPYALRWDGAKWEVAKAWPDEGQITDMAAFGPTDVWVFGAPGANIGLGVWHFDGTQWTQTQLDFFPGEASAVSPSDIWTVGRGANGDSRLVAHYNGASWEQVDLGDALPPDIWGNPDGGELAQNVFLSDVEALSADDVWVTGHVYRSEAGVSQSSPVAAHWNGQVWQQVSVPGGWTPGSIAPDGSGGLWFSGYKNDDQPVLMHRTASGEWSTKAIRSGARTGRIWDFARIPGTTALWGVGDLRPADNSGSDGAIFANGKVPKPR